MRFSAAICALLLLAACDSNDEDGFDLASLKGSYTATELRFVGEGGYDALAGVLR
jgi:hypothetical protein